MFHRKMREYDLPERRDALVHPSVPGRASLSFQHPFADVGAGRSPRGVERDVIAAHDGVRAFVFQSLAQFFEKRCVFLGDDVVRVQPHDVRAGREGKREIARSGKVVPPGEGDHLCAETFRNGDGAVRAARVRDDYLVHGVPHAAKRPREHLFLIAHDHAQRKQSLHSHLPHTAFI